MKAQLFAILLIASLFSCKKEIKNNINQSDYFNQVIKGLHDSLTTRNFATLDLSKAIRTKEEDGKMLLRIFVKGKELSEEFVLIETDDKGNILRGKQIYLQRSSSSSKAIYNGNVIINSLDGKSIITSEIINGYIKAYHPDRISNRMLVVPIEKSTLPEVVVTCYISSGGISYFEWMNVLAMFGGGANCYSFMAADDGGGGGIGGGSSSGGTGGSTGGGNANIHGISEDQPIFIDFEDADSSPAIEVDKYLKCFSNIPDVGSSCSIEILTDIPVDSDPNQLLDWSNGATGHAFIQITKSNGSETVQQNLGFYPKYNWETVITTGPVESKVLDNGKHEYNAALKMDISPNDLKTVIDKITTLANSKPYNITNYNCTDFALDVINSVRLTNKLEVPRININRTNEPYGSNTPQGLYQKLKSMKETNSPEAANITIPRTKAYAGGSHGPCN